MQIHLVLVIIMVQLSIKALAHSQYQFFLNQRNTQKTSNTKVTPAHFNIFVDGLLECPDRFEVQDQTQVQQLMTNDQKKCFVSPHNRNNYETLIYRSYLFSSHGYLMAFLSFGPGDEKTHTGAKEFYFFPRNLAEQKYNWDPTLHQLNVRSSSNYQFVLDTWTTEIIGSKNVGVDVDPKISPDNNAGLFLKPETGIIYELPFTLGNAPSSSKNLDGVFIDQKQNRCTIKVKEILKSVGSGESEVKLTDAQIKSFLAIRCPQLVVNW